MADGTNAISAFPQFQRLRLTEILREPAQSEVYVSPAHSQLEDLYRTLQQRVYRFALFLVRDEGLAEDMMQEAFLRFYSHRIEVESSNNAYAWLTAAVTNQARNHWRGKKYRATQAPDERIFEMRPDTTPSQEGRLIRNQHLDKLQEMVEELDGIEKECILLYAKGMTFKNMADILGVNLSTAINKTTRAIKLMNKRANRSQI